MSGERMLVPDDPSYLGDYLPNHQQLNNHWPLRPRGHTVPPPLPGCALTERWSFRPTFLEPSGELLLSDWDPDHRLAHPTRVLAAHAE